MYMYTHIYRHVYIHMYTHICLEIDIQYPISNTFIQYGNLPTRDSPLPHHDCPPHAPPAASAGGLARDGLG